MPSPTQGMADYALKVAVAIAATYAFSKLAGSLLRRYFIGKLTALRELEGLGIPRPESEHIKGTAVVCGGSIAGLWTARVCADHFEEVVIVESEEWLETPAGGSPVYGEKGEPLLNGKAEERNRVMQYKAAHCFMGMSHLGLQKLFPGINDEWRKRDVHVGPADFKIRVPRGAISPFPLVDLGFGSEPETFFPSREAYERLLRKLVREYPRVCWVAGTVTGLNPCRGDYSNVESVNVRVPLSDKTVVIPTALVVDCTGKTQAGLKWLQRFTNSAAAVDPSLSHIAKGCLPFEKLRIKYDIKGTYRAFRFDLPLELRSRLPLPVGYDNAHWLYTYVPEPGQDSRFFVLSRLEGHRLELSMSGWGEPTLPDSVDEIQGWFKSLKPTEPLPEWLLELASVMADGVNAVPGRARISPCSWIRYERAANIPSNFIAIGDSVMTANPIWGQGCTKAALGAMVLDGILRRGGNQRKIVLPSNFSTVFFKRQYDVIRGIWNGTKPTDYSFATTEPVEGETLQTDWLMGSFMRLLMTVALEDRKVSSVMYHIRNLLAPSTDVLHPGILAKALWMLVRKNLALTPTLHEKL